MFSKPGNDEQHREVNSGVFGRKMNQMAGPESPNIPGQYRLAIEFQLGDQVLRCQLQENAQEQEGNGDAHTLMPYV